MIKKIIVFILLAFLLSKCMSAQNDAFTLKAIDLGERFSLEQIYDKYNCGGQNISPHLKWQNAPEGTKSYALTIFDPDAPTENGWWHWLVFNIPTNINELPTDAGNPDNNLLPAQVVQSINDYKEYGYGGPCPPKGDKPHRYIITVYALKAAKIDLDKNMLPETVNDYLQRYAIGKATLIAYYQR